MVNENQASYYKTDYIFEISIKTYMTNKDSIALGYILGKFFFSVALPQKDISSTRQERK